MNTSPAGIDAAPGAVDAGGGFSRFRVWAPRARRMELVFPDRSGPASVMERGSGGVFSAVVRTAPGDRYLYRLDGGEELPDPASRHQPDGVGGPSAVVSGRFPWSTRDWRGLDARDAILYEIHVGTFTREGTFDAAAGRLHRLVDLGVTAVEVMPIAEFAGGRNWGYDGVFPFAAQSTYGGPDGFRRFVDACHGVGIAVVLDVVYNHVGPEGSVHGRFAPFWSARHRTPWGRAPDFDGPNAEPVRRYYVENALWWFEHCRVDGFRFDAVHAISDDSPERIEAEIARRLAERAGELGRRVMLFAESHLVRPDLLASREAGGCGHDAQWSDDLCLALHPLVGGETRGRYARFGTPADLASVLRDGLALPRPRGDRAHSYDGLEAGRFVVFAQNHDQVACATGRARLAQRACPAVLRLVAATVIHAPDLPLLFMGEEYGATSPFPFFTSHADAALGRRVRKGRRRELRDDGYDDEVADPQAEETFLRAVLDESRARTEEGRRLLAWYRELIRLRRERELLRRPVRAEIAAEAHGSTVVLRRGAGGIAWLHFGEEPAEAPVPAGKWRVIADSEDSRWGGRGRAPARIEGSVTLAPRQYLLACMDSASPES